MKLRKKAALQVPGSIVDIYAVIGFVVVLFVFILLFQIQGCVSRDATKAEIASKAETIDEHLVLLNYLRNPVDLDGLSVTIADLIVLYKSDLVSRDKLVNDSKKIFSKLNSECIVLCIDNKKFEFNDCSDYDTACKGAKQQIPFAEELTEISLDLSPEALDIPTI